MSKLNWHIKRQETFYYAGIFWATNCVRSESVPSVSVSVSASITRG